MKNSLFGFIVLSILVAGCSSSLKKKDKMEQPQNSSTLERPFVQDQVWKGYYICGQGKTKLNLRIQNVSADKVKTELGDAYDVAAVFDFDFKNRTKAGAFHLLGKYYPEKGVAIFDPSSWIKRPSGYRTVGMDGLVSKKRKNLFWNDITPWV